MDETITIKLEVRVPASHARALLAGITGHDDDLLLAAEKALREGVERHARDGECIASEGIEIEGLTDFDYDELKHAAQRNERELQTYGPYAV